MTLQELETYFYSFLKIDEYSVDPSRNGVKVENSNPAGKEIKKVAFAVDACAETIIRAGEAGAGLLFVHHGLLWGQCQRITGTYYQRMAQLIHNDMALFACHIPLDANKAVGNNYGLARRMGLASIEPFGEWHGMTIGVAGSFPVPVSIHELAAKLFPDGEKPVRLLPFGKKEIQTVAVISGGAGDDLDQAITAGYDAFVTGEIGHEQYHVALESKINVIAGGHYQTETIGVQQVKQQHQQVMQYVTLFIDVPTGL